METTKPGLLTPNEIGALRAVDTPTICNAIEIFEARGRIEGFMGMDIRCLLPELGTMTGYAVTVTVDSTTQDAPGDPQVIQEWIRAMDTAPKPAVLVFQDIGPEPRKSAHLGEVMGTIARRLGVVGIVTDGGLRDILELKRLGFHCFAAGLVPSHGNPRLIEVNCPVVIDKVKIEAGDLIHGDVNGVTLIPRAIAHQVAAAAAEIHAREGELIRFINSPEFTVEGLLQRWILH